MIFKKNERTFPSLLQPFYLNRWRSGLLAAAHSIFLVMHISIRNR